MMSRQWFHRKHSWSGMTEKHGNSPNCRAEIPTPSEQSCKHASIIEERCFLRGPCCAAARTKRAATIEAVLSAWSLPKVYKGHGKSPGAVELRRTKWAEYDGVKHRLGNWNFKFRNCNTKHENENWVSCRLEIVRGKLVVEEDLEVRPWKISVRSENVVTVRLF
jgi:hypothetical protein